MKPYLIATPSFMRYHAGVRVLFKLARTLSWRGYESYVSSPANDSPYSVNVANPEIIKRIAEDGIVVYPEICPSNEFSAKKTVSFIAGSAHKGDKMYDISFYWDECLIPANDINRNLLRLDVIEHDLFNESGIGDRDIVSLYVGKGNYNDLSMIKEMGTTYMIDTIKPTTRMELANILKRSKILYTADQNTMLIEEAIQCGTPVLVASKNKDIIMETNPNHYGIAYTSEEIPTAKNTLTKAQEAYYNKFMKDEDKFIDNFISLTQAL